MRFYRGAARLQAPSQAVARAIAAEAPDLQGKISVIPYPTLRLRTDPEPIDRRAKTILFVGRIHPEKGVHLLADAFVNLPRDLISEWKLCIVGPSEPELGGGGKAYLHELDIAATKAGGTICLHGPVFDSAELEQHFRAARLFVYPSLAEAGESFGLAPLEAMAHGCGVIVSRLECFSEFVRESETGFFFDHRQKNPAFALRDKIERVLADQALLARVSAAGYRESADFSVDRVADRFLHDFSSLISQPEHAKTNR
jgi:glycosyltransferase involved in cell wall biosynthesis